MNEIIQKDPLLVLHALAKGAINITLNDHTTSYRTVTREIEDYKRNSKNFRVEPAICQEMIEAGSMVRVTLHLTASTQPECFWGATARLAVDRALTYLFAKQTALTDAELDQVVEGLELGEVNLTDALDELGATCKASVDLDINEYKVPQHWNYSEQKYDSGYTAEKWLADERLSEPDKFEVDADGHAEISEEEAKIMAERDEVLYIHFYPNTPNGFYSWYHTDFGQLLSTAVALARREVAAWG